MKLRHFTAALALAGMATPAFAQSEEPEVFIEEMIILEPDGEAERLKREILREVDRRIAKQLDALRRDIRKMLAHRGDSRRNHTAPRPPHAPRPPRAPRPHRAPKPVQPQTKQSRTYFVTPDGRRLELRTEHDARKKSAYLQQKRDGKPQMRWVQGQPKAQRMRVTSHSNSRDGHAKIRIEVNGKVIEKTIPLGESFELKIPGGSVWVKTDGHSKSSKSAKKFAHKNLRKRGHDSKRRFDFDFDEQSMKKFGKHMEEWGKKFEHDMKRKFEHAQRDGKRLEFELHEFEGELPKLHAQLKKLMGHLSPEERREVERAMKELHGLFGPRKDDRKHSDRRYAQPKGEKYEKKSQRRKYSSKKRKQTTEEESF